MSIKEKMAVGHGGLPSLEISYTSPHGTAIRDNCGIIGTIRAQFFHDNRHKVSFVGVVRSQCV